jgi:hypothetical protein
MAQTAGRDHLIAGDRQGDDIGKEAEAKVFGLVFRKSFWA